MRWYGRRAAGAAALMMLGLLTRSAGVAAQAVVDPGAAAGQSRPGAGAPLTLDEAVRSALATHPALAGAQAGVDRAEAVRADAVSAWLPSLSLDAAFTRYQKPMVVAPLHGFPTQANPSALPVFDRGLAQGGISGAWTLFDGGARGARIGRARALEHAASSTAGATRLQVLSDVARAYVRVGSAREVLAAHDRRVAALAAERDRAAKVFEQGRAPRVTLLRGEASLSQAQADRESARMDVEVAEQDLARLMGVDAERVTGAALPPVRLAADSLPARSMLLSRAEAANPELEALRGQEAAARAGRSEARSLWMPRLQLIGRYSQFGSQDYSPTREWQGGVQLSYPLFTGGSRVAAGERADADLRSARSGLAQAEMRLQSGVDQALAAVRSARARVAALASAVTQAEEVARIEKLALDAGSGVQTDYLTAESQLLGARASLTQARGAEAAARIELARVTGELSQEWLRSNLESQP